ncbi:MAG: hypothetical protein ACREAA_08855 [Candidatus Polarisedimenticolia bacterium]
MVTRAAIARGLSLTALVLAVVCASGPAHAVDKRIVVQGRVLAADGTAMTGWPVQVIGTQRYIELNRHTTGGQVATVARTTTDENGYFSFDLPREGPWHYYFVRPIDQAHLDPVRWLVPDDVEVTTDIRRGRVAQVQATIRPHPDWPEVERQIAEAGGETTQRGRILRTLGLPEKRVNDQATGEEEWWYFTHGILYTFQKGQPTGSRRFEPVAPPPKTNGGAQGGAR